MKTNQDHKLQKAIEEVHDAVFGAAPCLGLDCQEAPKLGIINEVGHTLGIQREEESAIPTAYPCPCSESRTAVPSTHCKQPNPHHQNRIRVVHDYAEEILSALDSGIFQGGEQPLAQAEAAVKWRRHRKSPIPPHYQRSLDAVRAHRRCIGKCVAPPGSPKCGEEDCISVERQLYLWENLTLRMIWFLHGGWPKHPWLSGFASEADSFPNVADHAAASARRGWHDR